MEDKRNLIDEFKNLTNEVVFDALEQRRNDLEVALFNVTHDFNMGTIVRNANNFNVQAVHIIGRRKYNRRGAMCTDKYLRIVYHATVAEFLAQQREQKRVLVAVENNVPRARALQEIKFSDKTTLIFGSESDGLSEELLAVADDVCYIESFGSTRSVNVGVAAGIVMYEWVRRRVLSRE